jgi:reprolysin-like metallo-peptidase family M12B
MKILLIVMIIIGLASWGFAEEAQILSYHENENRAPLAQSNNNIPQYAIWKVSIHPTLVELPGQITYEVTHDRKWQHKNGDITWVGYLSEFGPRYRVIITQGKDHVIGSLSTPEGNFKLKSDHSGTWLIDIQAAGQVSEPFLDDYMLPPIPTKKLSPQGQKTQIEIQAADTVIDIMVLYTNGFASQNPGSLSATRINNLIDLTNQAYEDSGIDVTLRLVHSQQIQYTDQNQNTSALTDITDGNSPFENIELLRTQKGADIVILLRPYRSQTQSSCGNGWLNGFNGQDISLYGIYGFSAVSDGSDVDGTNSFCSDYSFAHEIGHNLGSAHDRANASDTGVYPYSYGHGVDGSFGTIMSYINPEVAFFSNPDIQTCNGNACGIDENMAGAANNALSIINSKAAVAAFMATAVVDSFAYYLPYFKEQSGYWYGLAIRNSNASQSANATITIYNNNGTVRTTLNRVITKRSQDVFVLTTGTDGPGWVKITSDQKLTGLSFLGTQNTPMYIADIPFASTLATLLHVPHAAQDNTWDSTIYASNPNNAAASILFTFVSKNGTPLFTLNKNIAANGSIQVSLSDLVQNTIQPSGSIEISSNQGIVGFIIYGNQKTGGVSYAGIAAVDPNN